MVLVNDISISDAQTERLLVNLPTLEIKSSIKFTQELFRNKDFLAAGLDDLEENHFLVVKHKSL